MTGAHTTPSFLLVEMGISWTVCLGWPLMAILPISAPRVTRITSMSHNTRLQEGLDKFAKQEHSHLMKYKLLCNLQKFIFIRNKKYRDGVQLSGRVLA
jgi:hypothetical protein